MTEKQASGFSPFVGCLRNVMLNGSPVVLQAESRVGHVSAGVPQTYARGSFC